MQVTNGNTTVRLDEEKILNMIIDQRLVVLEKVFKKHYQVTTIRKLTESQFYKFMYLCIVVLEFKAVELCDTYSVSVNEIISGTKKVFERSHTDKLYYAELYNLYITYRQELKLKNNAKNVA